MRTASSVIALSLLLLAATPVAAQQRIDRFPDARPARISAPIEAIDDEERGSYWFHGALVGAAAGVIAGLVWIEDSGSCTTGVPGVCHSDGTKYFQTALLGVAGSALGLIVGSSIPRGDATDSDD